MIKERIKFMGEIIDEMEMSQIRVAQHLEMHQSGVSMMLGGNQRIRVHHLIILDSLRDKPSGIEEIKDQFDV